MKPENIAAIVTLVSVMLSAGLEINVEHLVDALKNYGLLARALACQLHRHSCFRAYCSLERCTSMCISR